MKKRFKITQSIIPFIICSSLFLLQGCGGSSSEKQQPEGSVGSGPGKATLSWESPTSNADGSSLTDLAGYRIYYAKTSPLSKANSPRINLGNFTTYAVSGLDLETYYFAVSALDFNGNESELSGEVDYLIQ